MRRRRIVYIQYTNPAAYPPLEHSARILANVGWRVMFLGAGAFSEANSFRLEPNAHIEIRQLGYTAGWKQKLHYAWFCVWCFFWVLRWQPDWMYASDLLACPPALLLSWLPGLPLIYHEHDSPGEPASIFMQFCMKTRRACARRASICVLPNAQRARRFTEDTQRRRPVEVVWNCPELREVAAIPQKNRDESLKLLYHGSISAARLPVTVIEALAALPNTITLTVLGYETIGFKGYTQALLARAEQLGIRNRVHYLGPVGRRDEMLQTCATCNVGLALVPLDKCDVNLHTLTGASNKPFDYLAHGLGVLVSDLPEWRAMFVDAGYGLACNPSQPLDIAAALRWFYEHPNDTNMMGERGRKRIMAEWNYEMQFQPVLKKLSAS